MEAVHELKAEGEPQGDKQEAGRPDGDEFAPEMHRKDPVG
jgi:hypothetical protein